ncbi:TonB-dependent receptor [Algoriphagus sp. C2-6-M1]|uniref:SusC/RagA family TonB-linked outer membrane protein n=1 Tax=Algoriphagus persicinus TaxID=3108754 RepID=UPI002B3D60A4|nr:TonB-dependent receptor [Algoriphagus sp. C2-6-M1]MEB2780463.1 TonB-dependent receptor [Algoriphagus sp. C2-6-M1]
MKKKLLQLMWDTSKCLMVVFTMTYCLSGLALANNSYAQHLNLTQITIQSKKTSVLDFFHLVEKQSEFRFHFNPEVVENKKIELSGNDDLETLLYEVAAQTRLAFKQVNESIAVKQTGKKSQEAIEVKVKISGRILDVETQEPIMGASVFISETSQGAMADLDGNWSLEIDETLIGKEIKASALGYNPEVITIREGEMAFLLIPQELAEVVVVGYGTQKKINLTGAVSQIGSEAIENRPSPNLTRMLQGALPNLNIKMVDGSPTRSAAFNIRGATSIGAGGDALVLIDGVEGDANLVNPNDVESVTILKDASSAAVYGSRAAFGVVLITTKNPKKGSSGVDVKISHSVNQRTVVPNLVTNGYEWAKNFDEAFFAWYDYKTHPISVNSIFPFSLEYLEELKNHNENPNLPETVFNEELNRYEYFGNTDWFKYLHKDNMPATEASISASGASDKASYYISGLYYHQDGIFNYSSDNFNKYNLRAKGAVNITDWLSLENNFDLSTYKYEYPLLANGDAGIWRYLAVQGFPMAVMQNPDGSFTRSGSYIGASYVDGSSKSDQSKFFIRNTPSLTATPFGDLVTFKANFTFSKNFNKDVRYNNFVDFSTAPDQSSRFGQSLLRQLTDETTYWGSNITTEFKKNLNEVHDFTLLMGYNVESNRLENLDSQRDGLLVETKPDFNLLDGLNYTIRGGGSEWKYMGVFYRLNYRFKEKYLLEFNGRYDGSSKFPSDQRFGFFPSVSAGWNVSEEGFMSNTKNWLDNLKIRSSYGTLGNGNVAPYRYMETMTVAKTSVILDGIQKGYTYLPGAIPNGLTWEKATTFDIGMDASLFSGKFTLSFDWYNRLTTDMFTYGEPLPNVFGATVPYGNFADLSTKGWEYTMAWRDEFALGSKPFSYSISGSLWDSRAEITKFNNPNKLISSTYYEGSKIGEIWGYETLGFFTSEEDVANHADQSFLVNSNNRQWLAGDLKYADLNNDGVINQGTNTLDNPGDRRIIGNSAPRYQFGFTLSGNWNGFGISAFLQGVGKRDWYFAPEADLFYGPYNRPYGFQPKMMMDDIWTEENPDAYFPRLRGYTALRTSRSLGAPQTRYLQDASYLRLKNVTLDYSIPAHLLSKIGMKKALVYVSGQNILTFSGLYKHTDNFDPEIIEAPTGGMTNSHGQGDAYPMLKTYTVGLNLSF